MKTQFLILLSLAGLFLASCAPSPEKIYKEFLVSQAHRKVGVATDVSVLQDGPGSSNILLSDISEKYAKVLNSQAVAQMKAKGYDVSSEYVSTGLNLINRDEVFISNDANAKTGSPLVAADRIKRRGGKPSKVQSYSAEQLFKRLIVVNPVSQAAHDAQFSEVRDLGLPLDSYVLAITGHTRNVTVSKQIGQGMLVAAVTLGTITMWEADSATIQFTLIDVKTGRIAWANQIVAQRGSPDFIEKQVANIFATMPAYGTTKP